MSEKFNTPESEAPPAPNPAELDARMEVLRKKHAEYETLIQPHNPSQGTLDRAKIMLDEIRAELDSIKEAMNPDKFEIKLRERLARDGNYEFVSAFTASGTAIAYTRTPPTQDGWRRVALIKRDGLVVYSAIETESNFENGFLIARGVGGLGGIKYIDESGNTRSKDGSIHKSGPIENGMAIVEDKGGARGVMSVLDQKIEYAYYGTDKLTRTKGGAIIGERGPRFEKFLHTGDGRRHGPFSSIKEPVAGGRFYMCTVDTNAINAEPSITLIDARGVESLTYWRVSDLVDGLREASRYGMTYILEENTLKEYGPLYSAHCVGEGLSAIVKKFKEPYMVTDFKGREFGPFDNVRKYSGGLMWVQKPRSMFGIGAPKWVPIDASGNEVDDYLKHLKPDAYGIAHLVMSDGKDVYIDTKNGNKEYSPPRPLTFVNGMAIEYVQGMIMLRDRRGTQYGPFDSISSYPGNLFVGNQNGNAHIISDTKVNVFSSFSVVGQIRDDLFACESSLGGMDRYYIYTKEQLLRPDLGLTVSGAIDSYGHESEGFISIVDTMSETYMLNLNTGERLGPYKFNGHDSEFVGGVARVTALDGRKIYINMRGEEVFKPN